MKASEFELAKSSHAVIFQLLGEPRYYQILAILNLGGVIQKTEMRRTNFVQCVLFFVFLLNRKM